MGWAGAGVHCCKTVAAGLSKWRARLHNCTVTVITLCSLRSLPPCHRSRCQNTIVGQKPHAFYISICSADPYPSVYPCNCTLPKNAPHTASLQPGLWEEVRCLEVPFSNAAHSAGALGDMVRWEGVGQHTSRNTARKHAAANVYCCLCKLHRWVRALDLGWGVAATLTP
jgi:hypothetical protein